MDVSVAAPGKVLVTGGYLITEPGYSGLVLVTDALFVATVRRVQGPRQSDLRVSSPQFGWAGHYNVVDAGDAVVQVQQVDNSLPNRYVQIAVMSALAYALGEQRERVTQALAHGIEVVILGGNDFYSQRHAFPADAAPTVDALAALPAFNRLPRDALSNLRKTGLGSSAALVTSLVGALLHFVGVVDVSDAASRPVVHNVAQFAHCLAQGRIGSGFDVSSAVYGSHRYSRFSPAVLAELLQMASPPDRSPSLARVTAALRPSPAWDSAVVPFALPPRLLLVLGDIDAGSNTPSLVGAVNRWRAEQPEAAAALWADLARANDRVDEQLRALAAAATADPAAYDTVLDACAALPADRWPVSKEAAAAPLAAVRAAFLEVRALLRRMGEAAGVPIEPPEQTALLDRCMALPGVVFGGVPGAGGFDAIFCIVIGEPARRAVREAWARDAAAVCPLLAGAAAAGLHVVPMPPQACQ